MKNYLVGAERTDGTTDISKLIDALRNFAKAPDKRLRVNSLLAFRCDISGIHDLSPLLDYLQCVRETTIADLS
jgi:hypothetical protein